MAIDMRARYLNQRVMTATPGQRVVMLYDRLHLDLTRAQEAINSAAIPAVQDGAPRPLPGADDISHAMQIIAELAGSLDITAGGPAENLGSLYGYLLKELTAVRSGETTRLAGAATIVATLREAWTQAVNAPDTTDAPVTASGGAWVG